jgi:hypothetical protein
MWHPSPPTLIRLQFKWFKWHVNVWRHGIWGLRGCEDVCVVLRGRGTIWARRYIPTFRRNILFPSSELKIEIISTFESTRIHDPEQRRQSWIRLFLVVVLITNNISSFYLAIIRFFVLLDCRVCYKYYYFAVLFSVSVFIFRFVWK